MAQPLTETRLLPAANVLGVRVDAVDMPMAIAAVESAISEKRSGYVCVTGVHGVMEAYRNSSIAAVLANARLVVPDGMPMVWVGRLQGRQKMDRVFGPDLMLELIRRSRLTGYTHFLCGGDRGVAEELQQVLQQRFPSVSIAGTFTPPFRSMTSAEEHQLIQTLNDLRPDIVWVGLSTPKQERFMAHMCSQIAATVMIGVGAAFDFQTGRLDDSPPWVKRSGLQWLHRLIQEPRRLWKRYLVNIPQFLLLITLQLTGLRRFEGNSRPMQPESEPEVSCHNPS